MKTNSRLLINEAPLQVLPSLALKFGLNEAIILQQMHYWLEINRQKKEAELFEDRYWTYNSYAEWQKQFPFFSQRTIQRTILHLQELGILLTRQPNAKDWNHTKYYTIDYDKLDAPNWSDRSPQIDAIDDANLAPSIDPKWGDLHLTETITEINPEIITERKPRDEFEAMQWLLEKHTGCPMIPQDIRVINTFIEQGITEQDIIEAITWRVNNGAKPVSRISQLEAGILTSKGKRIQGETARNGKRPAPGAANPAQVKPNPETILQMREMLKKQKEVANA